MNRFTEILDKPVTPRELLRETKAIIGATVVGAVKGFDQLSRREDGDDRDFETRATAAALIPFKCFFAESRKAVGRLFGGTDPDKK